MATAILTLTVLYGMCKWSYMVFWEWLLDLLWDKWLGDAYRRWIERRWRDD